jgi:hypothetical protein
MRPTVIRLAILGLGLSAGPVLAQGGGTRKPEAPAVSPPGIAAAPATTGVPGDSPLNGGDPTARVADVVAPHAIDQLLQQAEQAVRQNNLALANELVERAEAQALTRSTIAGTETIPSRSGAIGRMAEARAAIARQDGSTAAMLIAEAASLARAQGL